MKNKSMNDKGLSYSKILIIITSILFVVCLVVGFKGVKNNVLDTAVYVTAISVSGGICGTSILYYFKKAQAENTMKLRIAIYQAVAKERLKFNESMMILMNEYNMSEDDVYHMESTYSDMDGFMNESIMNLDSSAEMTMQSATSEIESQTF